VTIPARWTQRSCATRYRLTVRYWAGLKAFGLKWFTIFTKAAYNMRFGIMAAGRWSHRLFVRCCAAAPAGRLLFGFGFYHQLLIINLASAAGQTECYFRHNAKP